MEIIHLVSGKMANSHALAVAVNNLATEQTRMGHSVKLWDICGEPNDDFQHKPYQTKLFQVKHFLWNTTNEINEAIKQIKKETVFHLHGSFIPVYFTLAYHLRKRNIPFVYTTYGMYNKSDIHRGGILRKLYFKLFEQALIRWSSVLHCTGVMERELVEETGVHESGKVVLIPTGLTNENRLIPPKLKRVDEPIFGYCGSLDIAEKGLDILLHAFAEYKFKYDEKGVLWIMGDGPNRETLYDLVNELGIAPHVSFKGSVYGLRKFEMLSKIDVFVRPSRIEHFPSAVLEAASSSVPSIVSKQTNIGDYINHYNAGYVLENNNPSTLAKTFLQCFQDIKAHQWDHKRRNAYRMVNEKFQWNKIAEEHIHVYEKVLEKQIA